MLATFVLSEATCVERALSVFSNSLLVKESSDVATVATVLAMLGA